MSRHLHTAGPGGTDNGTRGPLPAGNGPPGPQNLSPEEQAAFRGATALRETPDQHVLWLVNRAADASERGDWEAFITEICHATYVGSMKGLQGVHPVELVRALRRIAGFGFPLEDGPEAA